MIDLLEFLIKPLVSDIKKVKIEKIPQGEGFNFVISIPKEDIAKVIGKEGKMIRAIKNLLKIRAINEKVYVGVEVKES